MREVQTHKSIASMSGGRWLKLEPPVGPESWDYDGSNADTLGSNAFRVPRYLTGKGTVIGILDFGVDIALPAFRSEDGKTRFLAIWDQSASMSSQKPNTYGYGKVYYKPEIDEALGKKNPYAALGLHPEKGDKFGLGAHGVACLDIAAGTRRVSQMGTIQGVAPRADLIAVHLETKYTNARYNLGDSVRVLEALDFIAKTAGDRPWVINCSIGAQAGPHDRTPLVVQAMDNLLSVAPGRTICMSTGNYRLTNCHTHGRLRPGGSRTLTWIVDLGDATTNELEVWYAQSDVFLVTLTLPDQIETFSAILGEEISITCNGHEVGKIYHEEEDQDNRDRLINIFLYRNAPAGRWNVTLHGKDIVDGKYHVWIERDTGNQSHLDESDATSNYTTGTICNGERTIAVGAYDSRVYQREIAQFSSCGPARDLLVKPNIIAPGVRILAARSTPPDTSEPSATLVVKSGTSMAAPHITGLCALLFEAAAPRKLSISETHRILASSADRISDGLECSGDGYVNIDAAIKAALEIGEKKNNLSGNQKAHRISESILASGVDDIRSDQSLHGGFEEADDREPEYSLVHYSHGKNSLPGGYEPEVAPRYTMSDYVEENILDTVEPVDLLEQGDLKTPCDRKGKKEDMLTPSEVRLGSLATATGEEILRGVNLHFDHTPQSPNEAGRIIEFHAIRSALKRGYAITMYTDIWFPRPINTSELDDLIWLIHELVHVRQYLEFGKDEFFRAYVAVLAWNPLGYENILSERKARLGSDSVRELLQNHRLLIKSIEQCLDISNELKQNAKSYHDKYQKILIHRALSGQYGDDLKNAANMALKGDILDTKTEEAIPKHSDPYELVKLVDRIVSSGNTFYSLRPLLENILSGDKLDSQGFRDLSPKLLFDAFVFDRDLIIRSELEQVFEVVGMPGSVLTDEIHQGDLLLREISGTNFAHVAVIASPERFSKGQLSEIGLMTENNQPGIYMKVVEGGLKPHSKKYPFTRRVTDQSGILPHNQLILRLRSKPRFDIPISSPFYLSEATPTPLHSRLNYDKLAQQIYDAISGPGTDEIKIYLALQRLEKDSTAIKNLDNEYMRKYNKSLQTALRSDLSGSELELALQLINKGKTGAKEEIKPPPYGNTEWSKAAERLWEAFKGTGTKEEVIYAVLIPFGRNPGKILFVLNEEFYKSRYKEDLRDRIVSELSGKERDYALYLLGEQPILDNDTQAKRLAQDVLAYIKNEADTRAKSVQYSSVSTGSKFYNILRNKYLKDYLSNPTSTEGIKAIEKIGRMMETRYNPYVRVMFGVEVRPEGGSWRIANNSWEVNSHRAWNRQELPALPHELRNLPIFKYIKDLQSRLGTNLAAATDILIKENVTNLPFLDVPFLVGDPNSGTGTFWIDVIGGGKNISQLMHWATGVKYSAKSQSALREVFLLYELWHLEGWDVFGQDPINDMISEEQGRILGVELLKGSSGTIKSETDLVTFLNKSFIEARAWIGALLRLRQSELDKWIISKQQKPASMHWGVIGDWHIWPSLTVYQMFADGITVDEVKNSFMVKAEIETYTLIYEADRWEKIYGPINLTALQKALIQGKLNRILKVMAKGEKSSTQEKLDAKSAIDDLKKL